MGDCGTPEREELKLPQLVPPPPPSPFVARLRGEVSAARGTSPQWDLQPSIGSWLTPRGRHREHGARRVSFADDEADDVEQRPRTPVMVELRIKGSTKPFTLDAVDTRCTIGELKVLCQSFCTVPAEQQRMLYKGKLLPDGLTLEGIGVPNKGVLFLAKGASAKTAPSEEAAAQAERERAQELERELEARAWALGAQGLMCIECGVNPGRLQTNGLCGICWREQVVRENKELKRRREEVKRRDEQALREAEERKRRAEELELRRQKDTSRCYNCQKKIGLTGFQCPCGYIFCAKHRYAEEHACTFDHQARGRELLAQQASAARGTSSSS